MLGERGEEAVIPLANRGVAVSMLDYLNERLGNDGSNNVRANKIPRASGGGSGSGTGAIEEQNSILKSILEKMSYMVSEKDAEIELLKGILSNTGERLVYDSREVANAVKPHLAKEGSLKENSRRRYR